MKTSDTIVKLKQKAKLFYRTIGHTGETDSTELVRLLQQAYKEGSSLQEVEEILEEAQEGALG